MFYTHHSRGQHNTLYKMLKLLAVFCVLVTISESSVLKRIVNGKAMQRGQNPWLVSLHYMEETRFTDKTQMSHVCAGTLINSRWVLTAAHCVSSSTRPGLGDPSKWRVVLGEHNQYLEDEGEQIMNVMGIYIHPQYDYSGENNLLNDIALLELSDDAEISQYIGLMGINEDDQMDQSRLHCTVAGWGQTAPQPYGWGMYIPLATDVYILDNDYCRDQYSSLDPEDMGMNFYIDDTVICAGMPPAKQSKMKDQNNDACAGDSGGALLCPTGPQGDWRVTGVVSMTMGCGSDDYQTLYTRVSSFRKWIYNTMNGNMDENPSHENFLTFDNTQAEFSNFYN